MLKWTRSCYCSCHHAYYMTF